MIFTSEMMHGWMVIMKVMDHVPDSILYVLRISRSHYNGTGGLKSALCIE